MNKLLHNNTLFTLTLLGIATALAFLFFSFVSENTANIALLYIIAQILIARYTNGYLHGLFSSVFSVICINFFFTYPFFRLNFTLSGYPVTFIGMLIITLLTTATTSSLLSDGSILSDAEKSELLENALIHSGSSYSPELTVTVHPDHVTFCVKDFGHGLNPDVIPDIFSGICHNTGSVDSHKGMGIGLSICKTIIDAHNGLYRSQKPHQWCFISVYITKRKGGKHSMQPKVNILFIEDERNILTFVRKLLYGHNYKVTTAITGTEGLQLINSICPVLILLDLGLPDMDGQTIIRQVREWSDCPIIVISARTNEHEKVKALDLGADDYITKPFGSAELLARIRTSLRHSTRMNTSSDQLFHPYKCGELILDFEKRTLTISGNIVHLTPIEYKILVFLAQNCGKVMTYSSIINNVWGPYADDNNRILRVNMTNIRRKIEKNPADPQYIFTEVGVGYRMSEEHC